MYELQLAQQRADELIIGINPQLIEPMLDLRRHILVKQTQRAKCQRQKQGPFYEFENCDQEQSCTTVRVRSFFRWHYISYRFFALSRTEKRFLIHPFYFCLPRAG
jgi:hypothetical protein